MTPTDIFQSSVDRVTLGKSAAEAAASEAERQGARRVFIMAGSHLLNETDEIDRIVRALGNRDTMIHTGIRAHVPRSDVVEAAAKALEFKPDLFLAVGGGSLTDTAKIVAYAVAHKANTRDKVDALRQMDTRNPYSVLRNPDLVRKVVCVPLTLSAGEYNIFAGSMDEDTKKKEVFSDHMMVPCCIILDPAITVHTPEWLWLSTGIRAVDHAVEALASLQSNFYADGMADSGLRLLVKGLAAVKRDPQDMEARLQCQVGAWQASVPFSVGVPLGASHAIGYGLGGMGVPHGYTSCVVMPHVQDWNADAIPERHQRIRECLGHSERPVGESLDRFIHSLGMPRRLQDVGLSEQNRPRIAEIAWAARWCRTNPKPITSLETVEEIVRLIPA